ncbi:riboflavin synthase [candidate division KSB1 bacterium]
MFTGIIQKIGKIVSVRQKLDRLLLQIHAEDFLDDVIEGSSIAVDGVCLTVTEMTKDTFYVDAIKETLNRTTLSGCKTGRIVNLEKALRFSDRLDGHIVQGHVDGTAKLIQKKESRGNIIMRFKLPNDLTRGLVLKGSVAIDGISLTISNVLRDSFEVSLIPFTLENTTLGLKKTGDPVNIETDIIGKYILKFLGPGSNRKNMQGFIK